MNKKKENHAADVQALQRFLLDIDCLDRLNEWTGKFNLFDVLKITRAEIRHSNVLAWLMNPNENHGFGDAVLRGFFQHAVRSFPDDSDIFATLLMDCYGFSIYREWHNIDIMAVSPGEHFVLCVENKIDTGEHDDQLNRYRKIVEDDYPDCRRMYIYLSPDGDESSDPEHWCAMSYRDVLDIIEKARERTELAPGAALLVDNYVDVIRRSIMRDEELARICAEIYAKHRRALDLIFENRPNLSSVITDTIRSWLAEKTAAGELDFRQESSSARMYRFKTKTMSELLPDAEGILSAWKTPNFFFYELKNSSGGEIYISLAIDTRDMPEHLREAFNRLMKHCKPNQKVTRYSFPFESRHYRIEEDEFRADMVTDALNRCFEELKAFETELAAALGSVQG